MYYHVEIVFHDTALSHDPFSVMLSAQRIHLQHQQFVVLMGKPSPASATFDSLPAVTKRMWWWTP